MLDSTIRKGICKEKMHPQDKDNHRSENHKISERESDPTEDLSDELRRNSRGEPVEIQEKESSSDKE